MELYPFQVKGLEETKDFNRVAYYWDMGTGKTFMGSEKMERLGATTNLLICQHNKISDWIEHFKEHYVMDVFDLTKPAQLEEFMTFAAFAKVPKVGIINYDVVFRRPVLSRLRNFTLMLDESSMIQNEKAKRSKYILDRLHPKNVILLSGTPTGGKYEKLWSQCRLLGWNITKTAFWDRYIDYYVWENEGWPVKIIRGYKNISELKAKLREHGASFLKTKDVMDLPEQIFQTIEISPISEYRKFMEKSIIKINNDTLAGNSTFKKRMYSRMLCGQYNKNKIGMLKTLVQSNDDRMLVFYCFDGELDVIKDVCKSEGRPLSVVNGKVKDLTNYENEDNSITAIQYQAGSMGLNLQKANKIIYFTPPDGMSESFEQSKKRIHRIGQRSTCFYYYLMVRGTVEEEIYDTLGVRKERTDRLFKEGRNGR